MFSNFRSTYFAKSGKLQLLKSPKCLGTVVGLFLGVLVTGHFFPQTQRSLQSKLPQENPVLIVSSGAMRFSCVIYIGLALGTAFTYAAKSINKAKTSPSHKE